MPLTVLLILVVGGIGAIVLLLHILGLSKRKTLMTDEDARGAWLREFAEDPPRTITLSHDHHAALIKTQSGQNGIIWPMGADTAVRYLTHAKIHQTKSGLKIDLMDFTAPHIKLALDPIEAEKWAEKSTRLGVH